MNQQQIEKKDYNPEGRLWVHSIFYTIQGEGPFAGVPAVFVRLQGCNLQCAGCDTIYTAPYGNRTEVQKTHHLPASLAQMVDIHFQLGDRLPTVRQRLVVITGGEPFRQNLLPFLEELNRRPGYFTQIETNGTIKPAVPEERDPSVYWATNISHRMGNYIVCSPKTPRVHPWYDAVACGFKYVLDHRSVDPDDGLPNNVLATPHPARVYRQKVRVRPIYLQPMDHTIEFSGIDQTFTHVKQQIEILNHKSLKAVQASCMKHGYTLQLQLHKILGVE